jgi:hypothetical protein
MLLNTCSFLKILEFGTRFASWLRVPPTRCASKARILLEIHYVIHGFYPVRHFDSACWQQSPTSLSQMGEEGIYPSRGRKWREIDCS